MKKSIPPKNPPIEVYNPSKPLIYNQSQLSGSRVSYKIINNTAGAWTTVVLFFIISILGKFLDSQLLFLNP